MSPMTTDKLKDLRDVLAKHGVEYLVLGKMGAILQGFPDTTQDADLFVEKTAENGDRLTAALRELGFEIGATEEADIRQGRDFIQLKKGPFRPGPGLRTRRDRAVRRCPATRSRGRRLPRVLDGGHHREQGTIEAGQRPRSAATGCATSPPTSSATRRAKSVRCHRKCNTEATAACRRPHHGRQAERQSRLQDVATRADEATAAAGTRDRGRAQASSAPSFPQRNRKRPRRGQFSARRAIAEPWWQYGGRPRTGGRCRRPRRLAREAQGPAVPSTDRWASRPGCEVPQRKPQRPRFASIAIASTIPAGGRSGRRPTPHRAMKRRHELILKIRVKSAGSAPQLQLTWAGHEELNARRTR